ncbi:MAG: peptidase S1, partial [Actinobacteria bacterium]|nr:peptidase S1 [Actinomycetota bacterium]
MTKTPDTPWWISEHPVVTAQDIKKRNTRTVGFGVAITMALIAGVVGSVAGRTTANIDSKTNLVTTKSVIERKPDSIAGIAARVSPSVVSIDVRSGDSGGTGSGFFLDSSGYILTNNHVISSAATNSAKITVKLANGKNYDAKLIGRDISYDLAVIKIAVTDAPALQLG